MANYYTKMPVWENRYNLGLLIKYRALIVEYFTDTRKASWMADYARSEGDRAKELRPIINR